MTLPPESSLLDLARDAMQRAYAPYSHFRVGAAVRSSSGAVYVGCNIENASYGATVCAERVAIAAMVAAGDRTWTEIAIVSDADPPATPCGMCLQVLVEFATEGRIFLAGPNQRRETSLGALLPDPFVLRQSK
jgi:cytidine deaminase